LALRAGYRESKEAWAEVLRDLKQRGMNGPRLVDGDGKFGTGSLWASCTRRPRRSALGTTGSSAPWTRCRRSTGPRRSSTCGRSRTGTPRPRPCG
jgi:hypothetical protein